MVIAGATRTAAVGLTESNLDSDLEVIRNAGSYSRPLHLRWRHVGVVAMGGAIGTAVREALSLISPHFVDATWVILLINVVGALLLGLLLESLARRGADEGRQRTIRLLVGTGGLGGFTTYSSLATAAAVMFAADRPAMALVYALATLILGVAASVAGIALGAALNRRRPREHRATR